MPEDALIVPVVAARFREVVNPVASLGFIGLSTDRASFKDFQDFILPFEGVAVHPTRIPFGAVATEETLTAMGAHLREAAAELMPGERIDTISFSCTSGSIAIGVERVDREIISGRPDSIPVNPISAVVRALTLIEAKRISLLMPYLQSTAQLVAKHVRDEGFLIDSAATFDLGGDPEMNRVDPECIIEKAKSICHPDSDALFISCTGWLTHCVVQRLEDALGIPVVTSNQALAWQALRGAGVDEQVQGQGRLFAEY